MATMIERWSGYLEQGGPVMPFLALAAALLWFALGYRLLTLRRGGRGAAEETLRRLAQPGATRSGRGVLPQAAAVVLGELSHAARRPCPAGLRPALDAALAPLSRELDRFAVLTRGIVMVAPLAGLLGTVSGMIETFEALGDMSLFSQSGGIAGGISQALITTQMGLAVAIPGLLAGRLLARRQQRLERDLERIKRAACTLLAEGQGASHAVS